MAPAMEKGDLSANFQAIGYPQFADVPIKKGY
jgi:hypothetical protein